jgi:dolichol-phosphate mannosyltransferase
MVQKQMKNLENSTHLNLAKTFIKFGTVGVTGTAIDFIILAATVQVFHISPILGKLIANESAIVSNFFFNNRWTFGKRSARLTTWQRFMSYNSTYLASLFLSVGLIAVLVQIFGPNKYLFYNILTIPINVIWNFVWSHFFTWKEKVDVATQ